MSSKQKNNTLEVLIKSIVKRLEQAYFNDIQTELLKFGIERTDTYIYYVLRKLVIDENLDCVNNEDDFRVKYWTLPKKNFILNNLAHSEVMEVSN